MLETKVSFGFSGEVLETHPEWIMGEVIKKSEESYEVIRNIEWKKGIIQVMCFLEGEIYLMKNEEEKYIVIDKKDVIECLSGKYKNNKEYCEKYFNEEEYKLDILDFRNDFDNLKCFITGIMGYEHINKITEDCHHYNENNNFMDCIKKDKE